ncbi:hypothetical protein LCGC14_2465810 [marine sediment metagenome]|uniref:DUF4433 domain-containing protein n=1 Tax=marine sediment metagenome TaxID=412755 RepID=A0A0F9E5S3_9ZZZZ
MRLYHWTNSGNVQSILEHGLIPNRLGIVYLTPSPDKWTAHMNNTCLTVETENITLTSFEDCSKWEVLCWGHVPAKNIKVTPVCPRCDGRRVVKYGVPIADKKRKCPKCKGTGLNDKEVSNGR